MYKKPKGKFGEPIFTRAQPGNSQEQDLPDNVSGQGLKAPHIDRQTMGAEAQEQFTAHDMIMDAMREIGEEPVPQGSSR